MQRKSRREQAMDAQDGKVQAEAYVPKPQVEKPAGQLLSSTLTLSSTEYGNQFINDNPDVSMNDVLKDPAEIEIQSMVESKKPEEKVDDVAILQRLIKLEKMVATMYKIDHIEAIEESVQGNVTNEVKNQLSKFIPKVTPSMFADSLTEYELKLNLYNMMQNSHSFLYHEKHLTLYNALINSMDVDEANIQDKDSKKRKRKDVDTSSSKKGKTQSKSSKEAKAPTKPLATYKAVEDEELIQDNVEDDDEMLQDDDMAVDDMPHDDDALTQEWSKWFKQDAVVRPETPNPEWYKEPIADDARLMIS
ncbi:hypothetical protein Tco_0970997 [Tanacetum coccineum]